MIERKCKGCGKTMAFRLMSEIKAFCSKKCYNDHRWKMAVIEGEEPDMPPLDAASISDDGFTALVAAIVDRASNDVTHFSPGTPLREDAEKFFLSDYFSELTGLEGEPILRNLEKEYLARKKRLKGAMAE